MRDGIYRITLKIDGEDVVAEAQVRNGVLQGLGEFAGLVGVLSTAPPTSPMPADDAPEYGCSNGIGWQREPLDAPAPPWLAIDAGEFANEARLASLAPDLRCVRAASGAVRRDSRLPAMSGTPHRAQRARDRLWTFGEWDQWGDDGPGRMN